MIDLIFCFCWDALIELWSHFANRTFFVQLKAFNPPPGSVYDWPFLGGGPDFVLFLCSSVVYTTRRFMFGLALLFVYHLTWGRGSWSLCLSCICLLAMHTLICVTFSFPPSVRCWLRLLLVALPGLVCLLFFLCHWLTSCVIGLCRYYVWPRNLIRWQKPVAFVVSVTVWKHQAVHCILPVAICWYYHWKLIEHTRYVRPTF